MSHILITRAHQLGEARVRKEIDALSDRLRQEFGAQCRWHGSCLHVSRSGVQGEISISDDQLTVNIRLGMIYGMMRHQIEQRIIDKLDERLVAAAGRNSPNEPDSTAT